MAIIAKGSKDFVPAPEGTHLAVCCDVVDLGELTMSYGGEEQTKHMVRIVWQIEEDMPNGKPFLVNKRYNLSLHEKATLRKDLESWRGRAFTQEELDGFDVESVVAVGCMLSVAHHAGSKGGIFANVMGVMKLTKNAKAPTIRDYVRECDREEVKAEVEPIRPSDLITDDDVPF